MTALEQQLADLLRGAFSDPPCAITMEDLVKRMPSTSAALQSQRGDDSVVDVVPGRRRRRPIAIVGAAAAIVIIAVLVSLLVSVRGPKSKLPSGPAPTARRAPVSQKPTILRADFTIDPIAGYSFSEFNVMRDKQWVVVSTAVRPSVGPIAKVTVFAPRAFDPSDALRGQALTVHGHRAYFAKIKMPESAPGEPKALTWEYKPTSWAVVEENPPDPPYKPTEAAIRAEEVKIANAINTSHGAPLLVPFKFGYLPPGLITELGSGDMRPRVVGSFGGTIGLGDGRQTAPDFRPDSTMWVWVTGTSDPRLIFCSNPSGNTTPRDFTFFKVGAHTGCLEKDKETHETQALQIDLIRGHLELLVQAGIYSDEELKRIAQTITVAADPNDSTTWFDATTAVPR
jgi:hypothetical protein